jgi:plastocyanin
MENGFIRKALYLLSIAALLFAIAAGRHTILAGGPDIAHNVINDDKIFQSKTLNPDEKFSFTFTKPGSYSYLCSIHPRMTGTIVVQ